MKLKQYRHHVAVLLGSKMFRDLNNAVYQQQKGTARRYTPSDFIREAISEKLERLKVEQLLKENKK